MQVPLSVFVVILVFTLSWQASQSTPLFEEQETLEITIEAPIRELIKRRMRNPVVDAVVRYVDVSGSGHALRAQLTSRGNSRLEACDFPPLRLILNEEDTVGTVFAGQDKLKMVTQCNKRRDGETWALQELGIYQAYNLVSDYSYRVRPLKITYVDSESARWKRTQVAFFIESTGEAATRLQRRSLRPPNIKSDQYNTVELANNLLFQLLIANTDFSIKKGPPGEGCCYNGRVLAVPGEQHDWIVLPYDFDQAGIINTDYALPNEDLGIRRVTNRLYRGFCWQEDSLTDAISRFQDRRMDIIQALTPDDVSKARKNRVERFASGFYNILDDPKQFKKRITDVCRGPSSLAIRKTATKE